MSSAKCSTFRLGLNVLTHWGRDKMAIKLENDIFNLNENCILIQFHFSLFIGVQWAIIGSGNGLVPNRRHVIIWTNYGL